MPESPAKARPRRAGRAACTGGVSTKACRHSMPSVPNFLVPLNALLSDTRSRAPGFRAFLVRFELVRFELIPFDSVRLHLARFDFGRCLPARQAGTRRT